VSLPEYKTRSSPRSLVLVTPVKVGEEKKHFFGYAMNISRSGLMIHTLTPSSVGREVNIEFTLPGSDITVKCLAKIVWNRSVSRGVARVCRLGLMFVDIAPHVAEKIDEWVTSQVGARAK
jgi:Tfp pilus assembly protein PilZ